MNAERFIVLEGGEGAGKSTIASFLKLSLSEKEVLVTRAGGSPFGEKLRALFVSDDAEKASPESRFALAFAAQADHVRQVVAPALAEGKQVISDRLDASIFAYQVYAENELHLVPLFWSTRKDLFLETIPDLYIFLAVDTDEGFKRARKEERTFDHFERRPRVFHERVREGYAEFLKSVPHVVVDANRPLEAVQKDVLSLVQTHLN
jgi:dTMP kinase